MNPICNQCGAREPSWLLTLKYNPRGRAGRLMAYCDACRDDRSDQVYVAIPYSVARRAPDLVLTTLYKQRLTESEPNSASSAISIAPGKWTAIAERLLREPKIEPQSSASLRAGYEYRHATNYLFDDNGNVTSAHDGPHLRDLRNAQPDIVAFDLGVQLGKAWEAVQSASVSEYQADKREFDRIAARINDRYGPVVALSTDDDAFHLRLPDTD